MKTIIGIFTNSFNFVQIHSSLDAIIEWYAGDKDISIEASRRALQSNQERVTLTLNYPAGHVQVSGLFKVLRLRESSLKDLTLELS